LTIPCWIVDALADNIDRLQAREVLDAAMVAQLPWLKERERARMIRRWQRIAYPQMGDDAEKPQIVAEDPEKARAWFARHGAVIARKKAE